MGMLRRILISAGVIGGVRKLRKIAEKRKNEEEKKRAEEESWWEQERKKEQERIRLIEEEEERRNGMVVKFEPLITQEKFEEIAISIAKPIKRLRVGVENHRVYGKVKTSSGINEWYFCLDFNDYGRITGRYWTLLCENDESTIPQKYAERIKETIEELLTCE